MLKEIVLNARIQARSTLLSGPSIQEQSLHFGGVLCKVDWYHVMTRFTEKYRTDRIR